MYHAPHRITLKSPIYGSCNVNVDATKSFGAALGTVSQSLTGPNKNKDNEALIGY